MQFFTKIDLHPFSRKISHSDKILSMGSCFAENIACKLSDAKFRITASPTGILFNPESIASALDRYASEKSEIAKTEIFSNGDLWSHYDFHSSFSDGDIESAWEKMLKALKKGSQALKESKVIIITFGTAWIYRLIENGKVVANCHKQPQRLFRKELLCVEHITKRYVELLREALSQKQVIFTISPVRHLGDGLEQNSLSKAILRVAIETICQSCSNAQYFPSYEIVMDELRDYRFYAEDMAHPSSVAVNYIWERFSEVAFSQEQRELIAQIERIKRASEHRPFNPQSDSHRKFCNKMKGEIESLCKAHPYLDLSKETEEFNRWSIY